MGDRHLCNFGVIKRVDILRMQSLIYNRFQHPAFRPMWLCGWRIAGFEALDMEFLGSPEMKFTFNDDAPEFNAFHTPHMLLRAPFL